MKVIIIVRCLTTPVQFISFEHKKTLDVVTRGGRINRLFMRRGYFIFYQEKIMGLYFLLVIGIEFYKLVDILPSLFVLFPRLRRLDLNLSWKFKRKPPSIIFPMCSCASKSSVLPRQTLRRLYLTCSTDFSSCVIFFTEKQILPVTKKSYH